MKLICLVCFLHLQFLSLISHGGEIAVDWSIHLKGVLGDGPILELLCLSNGSNYRIKGTVGTHPGQNYYPLPPEISGKCLVGMDDWNGLGYEVKRSIEVDSKKSNYAVKFPSTSAYFEVKVSKDLWPEERKNLLVYQIGEDGLPCPHWCLVIEPLKMSDDNGVEHSFIIPHLEPTKLVFCIELRSTQTPTVQEQPILVKSLDVTADMLLRHDGSMDIGDMFAKAVKVPVSFTANDKFDGRVAISLFRPRFNRRVSVDETGKITNDSEKREENEDEN